MTETIRWRIDWKNLYPIPHGSRTNMIFVITFFIFFAVGQGQGYNYPEDYSYKQSYRYQAPTTSSYSSYNPPPPQNDIYTAITYQELNASIHCGVIPDTNFELYRSGSDPYEIADVAPYGKFPWIVLILSYNKVVCQGTLIHYNLILTSARCIPEYTSLEDYEVRVGDWDVLTDYNEYEAYTNSKFRICSRRALSSYSEGDSYYSGYSRPGYGYNQRVSKYYGKDSSDLILVKSDFESTLKFPQVRPICLPKSYSSPNYYDQGQDQYSTYAVCWVAGWYGSDKIQLRNHPSAEKVKEYGYGGYYSDGYGSSSNYYQKYYKGYDSSMIQKRAKVKQVDCPSSYGNSYSYGYSSTEVCFVGIDGYDACVAEQGAAVFCVIKENENYGGYDSGYNNPAYGVNVGPAYESVDASYEFPVMSSLHPEYNAQNSYYSKPEIKANPSPSKPNRYRAILYAVVQKPSKCGKSYDSYGYGYSRKSRPLVATRVDYETVSGIMDLFWSHGYDKACPVTKSYYKEPKSNYGYGSNKSYKSFYYFGTYAPLNRYGYGRRPMSFSIYY